MTSRSPSADLELEQLARIIVRLSAKERLQLRSLLATLEEAKDPGALKALRESEEDVRAKRLHTFDEIFADALD